ncbi:50S ribosomal protein L10 [Candidatus Woesearchaeota archaeon]|nr:50S ribosomal protein L10 [Candidatus Woesearchaeota archaeon]
MKAHVADYKKENVKEYVDLIKEYPVIGALNVEGLPTPQLQTMRASLRPDVIIKVSKRRIIKLALEDAKKEVKGIEGLEQNLKGMPALIFSKENPFKLYKKLEKSKSPAPAKAGQTAPQDIIVKAGKTQFAPGPIIGELGSIGIKTGVEEGKVAIKEDSIVAKEGEKIKPKVAEILTRMNIMPMEVGLDLVAAYEKGVIYDKKVLAIDEEKFMQDLNNAAQWAFNLAVEAGFLTSETTELMVTKAFNEAKALAVEAGVISKEFIEQIISKAEAQMSTLKSELKI